MRKKIEIDEVHNLLLNIASEFHNLCVKYNIPYYMIGGTMLGAIRHKGFIPWDDDMDFGIPREHYNRFLQIASQELPSPYKLLTINNSAYALMGISKITDTRTLIHEKYAPKTTETIGLNIDIFPLDSTNNKKGLFSRNKKIELLLKIQRVLFINYNCRKGIKKIIAFILQKTIKISPQKNIERINAIIEKRKNKEDNMWTNFFGTYGSKEIVNKHIFGIPVLYQFESTKFYGVNDYDAYLKHIYSDYMKLPPKEKRHIHHENIEFL